LGVHGTTAITCITAQNPSRVSGIQPCSPAILRRQLDAVWEGFAPGAAKTGMLFSADLIRVVARFFLKHREVFLVIDPVMVATSGARLLKLDALKILERHLFPLAALITPNVPEAELLLRIPIANPGTFAGRQGNCTKNMAAQCWSKVATFGASARRSMFIVMVGMNCC